MALLSTWLSDHTAPTPEDMQNGDGCHPDETKALSDYLNNSITSGEAAERITKPMLNEEKPADKTYRLWGLLGDAMVELDGEHRTKTLDLLSQIRNLPATPDINWAHLPGLGSMWDTLWRLHLHGPGPWEKTLIIFDKEKIEEFRQMFDTIGRVESEMLIQGFDTVTNEDVAFKVLNLTLSKRAGLDIFMSEIFARLDVVGKRLKEKAESADDLAEKWIRWKEALLTLSQEGSRLSEEGKRLAAQCYELM